MNILITVEEGAGKGRTFEFADPDVFLIGRSTDAHLVIGADDTAVSRRHCLLEIAPPHCSIRDLGSTNGTFVNGVKITQATLRHDDLLAIGRTTLRVRIVDRNDGATICQLCGSPATEGVCQVCRDEYLNPVQAISDGKILSDPAPCLDCGCDLASKANTDGLGTVFRDVALYLCQTCSEKRFNLARERSCGEFRLLRQLGVGGMGTVYLAWDPRTCRLGALKRISLPFPDDLTVRRFLRETRMMAGIRHPNCVRLFRQGIHQGVPFLVSEYLTAGSVADRIGEAGTRLPIELACRWIRQVLAALAVFHGSGNVHRDIKPGNILLRHHQDGGPEIAKLADFGLAKSFAAAGGTVLTQADTSGGSLQYMPPEQIVSFRTLGPAADIYALGITLYQMVSGALPFADSLKTASNLKDVLLILLEEQPAPIRHLNPAIPPHLAAVIEQAISKNPTQRPGAVDFGSALDALFPS